MQWLRALTERIYFIGLEVKEEYMLFIAELNMNIATLSVLFIFVAYQFLASTYESMFSRFIWTLSWIPPNDLQSSSNFCLNTNISSYPSNFSISMLLTSSRILNNLHKIIFPLSHSSF